MSHQTDTKLWIGTMLLLATVQGCARSGTGDDPALADTLKARIAEAYDFSRPGVLQRMTGLYPDSGRVVSASGGQVTASVDSLRAGITRFWTSAGHNMRDAHWEWGEVQVERLGPDDVVTHTVRRVLLGR